MDKDPSLDKKYRRSIVWFRRDLRSFDHAALYHALKDSEKVFPVFIFDTDILDKLPSKKDRRVEFILLSLKELREAFLSQNSDLLILRGSARELIPQIAEKLEVQAVFANQDYEPKAMVRDEAVSKKLKESAVAFHAYKDQVIFEKQEILTAAGTPFKVFTAYKNAWLACVSDFYLKAYPVKKYSASLAAPSDFKTELRDWSLQELGFEKTNLTDLKIQTGMSGAKKLFKDFLSRIDSYHQRRDFPSVKGPSYLSVHLRFGTVSIRELAREAEKLGPASKGVSVWLAELIWRDFYFMILANFPYVEKGCFHREYDAIDFPDDKKKFKAWCEARTGYPIVDAAMRQLNQTGYMHNRLRMVTASFLVKDLHVDWRQGEKYFAQHLIDFDLSANNGGWQWSASTGCDAQPYFRIFNPVSQSERFDAEGKFIKRYLPELAGFDAKYIHTPWLASADMQKKAGCVIGMDYPAPIVDHAEARKITLELFNKTRKGGLS